MDFGTYGTVHLFGVSVVFAYMSTHYALGSVAGLLVPSSLLIRGAPVAPPTLPVFFSLRPAVVRATKELALRPAPPHWASAVSPFVLLFVVFFLVLFFFVGEVCRLSVGLFGVRLARGFVPRVSQWTAFLQLLPYFYAVSRVPGFTRISGCEGHFAQILHAELASNVLMEPACHFMVLSRSDSKMLLFQVHWEDTDSCWGGIPQARPLLGEPYFIFFYILKGEKSTQSGMLLSNV